MFGLLHSVRRAPSPATFASTPGYAHQVPAGLSRQPGALAILFHHCAQNCPCEGLGGSDRFSHSDHPRRGSECHRNDSAAKLIQRGVLPALRVQRHLAGGVERVHRDRLRRGLPGMKVKNLASRLDAERRLFLLLLAQLAADSGEGSSQIGFHTLRVAERRIENGLHRALHRVVLSNTSLFHAPRPIHVARAVPPLTDLRRFKHLPRTRGVRISVS